MVLCYLITQGRSKLNDSFPMAVYWNECNMKPSRSKICDRKDDSSVSCQFTLKLIGKTSTISSPDFQVRYEVVSDAYLRTALAFKS
jgi:hypothetical protein